MATVVTATAEENLPWKTCMLGCKIVVSEETEVWFLPCLHVLCKEQCVAAFKAEMESGMGKIKPHCKKCFRQVSLEVLWNKVKLKNFLPKKLALEDIVLKCGSCVVPDPVVAYCPECNHNLCHMCAEFHSRLKITQGHKLDKNLTDRLAIEFELTKKSLTQCEVHNGKYILKLCLTCQKKMCETCGADHKNNHLVVELADEVAAALTKIPFFKETQEMINLGISQLEERLQSLKKIEWDAFIDDLKILRERTVQVLHARFEALFHEGSKLRVKKELEMQRKLAILNRAKNDASYLYQLWNEVTGPYDDVAIINLARTSLTCVDSLNGIKQLLKERLDDFLEKGRRIVVKDMMLSEFEMNLYYLGVVDFGVHSPILKSIDSENKASILPIPKVEQLNVAGSSENYASSNQNPARTRGIAVKSTSGRGRLHLIGRPLGMPHLDLKFTGTPSEQLLPSPPSLSRQQPPVRTYQRVMANVQSENFVLETIENESPLSQHLQLEGSNDSLKTKTPPDDSISNNKTVEKVETLVSTTSNKENKTSDDKKTENPLEDTLPANVSEGVKEKQKVNLGVSPTNLLDKVGDVEDLSNGSLSTMAEKPKQQGNLEKSTESASQQDQDRTSLNASPISSSSMSDSAQSGEVRKGLRQRKQKVYKDFVDLEIMSPTEPSDFPEKSSKRANKISLRKRRSSARQNPTESVTLEEDDLHENTLNNTTRQDQDAHEPSPSSLASNDIHLDGGKEKQVVSEDVGKSKPTHIGRREKNGFPENSSNKRQRHASQKQDSSKRLRVDEEKRTEGKTSGERSLIESKCSPNESTPNSNETGCGEESDPETNFVRNNRRLSLRRRRLSQRCAGPIANTSEEMQTFLEAPMDSLEIFQPWHPYPVQGISDSLRKIDNKERNDDYCSICRDGGEDIIVCCDVCPKVFHLKCHIPVLQDIPKFFQCNFDKSKETLEQEIEQMPSLPNSEEVPLTNENKRQFLLACKFMTEVYKIPEIPTMKWKFPEKYYHEYKKVPYHLKFLREKLTMPEEKNQQPFANVKEYLLAFKQMFSQAFKTYQMSNKNYKHANNCLKKFQTLVKEYYPHHQEIFKNIEASI